MRKLSFVILISVLVLIPLLVHAQKITVDPNASGTSAAQKIEQSPLDIDPRLVKKVSCWVKRKPLHTIIEDLSSQTGISLKSGYTNDDWQVRARKMNVFAKDVPLRDLMRSISHVMKFKWQVNKRETGTSYRLLMDRRTLTGAEADKLRSEAKFNEEVKKRRVKLVDSVMSNGSLTPAEIEKLKSENPYLYSLEKSGAAGFMRGLFSECPEAKQAVIDGDAVYPDVKKLSPATQKLMYQAVRGRLEKFNGNTDKLPADMEKSISDAWLRVYCKPFFTPSRQERLSDWGAIGIKYGPELEYYSIASLSDQDDKAINLEEKAVQEKHDTGCSWQEAFQKYQSDFSSANAELDELVDKCRPGEALIEHVDEPWQHEKIKIDYQKPPVKLRDILELIASASSRTIVSDDFITSHGTLELSKGEHEIGKLLADIAKQFYYNWDKPEDALELRSRDWFLKRDLQIPDEWVKTWSDNTKKNGYISLDDMVSIALLNKDQLDENLSEDKVLGTEFMTREIWGTVRYNSDVMGLYRVLDAKQKKMLEDGLGVNLRAVTPEQEKWVTGITDRTTDYGPNQPYATDPQLTLFMKRKVEPEKGYAVDMEFHTGNGYKTWMTLILPKYTPPVEEKDKSSEKH